MLQEESTPFKLMCRRYCPLFPVPSGQVISQITSFWGRGGTKYAINTLGPQDPWSRNTATFWASHPPLNSEPRGAVTSKKCYLVVFSEVPRRRLHNFIVTFWNYVKSPPPYGVSPRLIKLIIVARPRSPRSVPNLDWTPPRASHGLDAVQQVWLSRMSRSLGQVFDVKYFDKMPNRGKGFVLLY